MRKGEDSLTRRLRGAVSFSESPFLSVSGSPYLLISLTIFSQQTHRIEDDKE
jgi:hypothetical protein